MSYSSHLRVAHLDMTSWDNIIKPQINSYSIRKQFPHDRTNWAADSVNYIQGLLPNLIKYSDISMTIHLLGPKNQHLIICLMF